MLYMRHLTEMPIWRRENVIEGCMTSRNAILAENFRLRIRNVSVTQRNAIINYGPPHADYGGNRKGAAKSAA